MARRRQTWWQHGTLSIWWRANDSITQAGAGAGAERRLRQVRCFWRIRAEQVLTALTASSSLVRRRNNGGALCLRACCPTYRGDAATWIARQNRASANTAVRVTAAMALRDVFTCCCARSRRTISSRWRLSRYLRRRACRTGRRRGVSTLCAGAVAAKLKVTSALLP